MVRIFLVVIGEPCGLFRGGGAEVEVDGEGKQTTVGHSWATGCRSMEVRPVRVCGTRWGGAWGRLKNRAQGVLYSYGFFALRRIENNWACKGNDVGNSPVGVAWCLL